MSKTDRKYKKNDEKWPKIFPRVKNSLYLQVKFCNYNNK
jgi:hypothetical protein